MVSGSGAVGGEIFVNIRTEGGVNIPGAGGVPRPVGGGGASPKDPGMSLLNDKQKEQLDNSRQEKKALKEYNDFQKLKGKENQNELLNELQRGRRQATMVAGAVTTGMLARNSKIMSTTMGSLSQMFGAFIDIFLMPFIPLIIPVLKYIADLIPRWMEWTQKFADLFAENPLEALRWAGEEFRKLIGDTGVDLAALFGISEERTRQFYDDVGVWASDAWTAIQTAWTTSLDYLKNVWEESGGSIWGSIRIMAEDAWGAALTGAETAWCAFAAWQPGVASAITSAWGGAAGYVKDIWEESGCSVWVSIQAIGVDAMGAIGRAGKWAWEKFASWQPGVAANIEGAWCAVSTYVRQAWEAGGNSLPGFFWEIAQDVGEKIKQGLDWLWSDTGGGFKSALMNILHTIQNWIYAKTGFGSPAGEYITEGSGTDPLTGARVPLSQIGENFPGSLDIMGNTAPGSATAPMWRNRLGLSGDMSWGGRGKDMLRGFGKIPFTDTDFFDQDANAKRNMYERFVEEKSLPFHVQQLEDRGHGVGEIQEYIQRRVRESYLERFSIVSLYKENGKWTFDVNINNAFTPNDSIDGMRIS